MSFIASPFPASIHRFLAFLGLVLTYLLLFGVVVFAQSAAPSSANSLLNVSYDVARELYKDVNPAFIAAWKAKTGQEITINQSHGGSSRQALAVLGGLEADVVTMNQSPDIDILVERGGLVAKDWRTKFPYDAAPYTTTTVFVVRKGNPKAIKDWNDLIKAGTAVIVPNPKVTGNGRYTYVAAYGYALKTLGDAEKARGFVKALFANVPVLDGGGRGATTTFAQRDIGDVLVTFENEAIAIGKEFGADKFDVIYPSISVDANAPVAVVESVATKRKSAELAQAYLAFLFSPEGQEIIAKHHFRPRNADVAKKYADRFPTIATFSVDGLLGGWEKVQKEHFADGAIYDQIMAGR